MDDSNSIKKAQVDSLYDTNGENHDLEKNVSVATACKEEAIPLDSSQGELHRYIRRLSIGLSDPRELSVDEQRLQNVLREAGEFSYGIKGVEVYSFEDPRLVPVGWWFREKENGELCVDGSERDVVMQPDISIPGVDLVGTLWQHSCSGMTRVSSFSSLKNRSWSVSFRQQADDSRSLPRPPLFRSGSLHWRELKSVIEDPDVIHGPRLEELSNAGFELATGIGFESHGTQGMVVYYTNAGVNTNLLTAVANETYLRRTSTLIGSVLTMAESRRASVAFQRQSHHSSLLDDSTALAPLRAKTNGIKQFSSSCCDYTRDRIVAWYKKSWGGESQIPPGMPFVETLWTIIGVFIGMLTVSSFNKLFLFVSDAEYFLIMGPFGALLTLQYGLSGAPASQPRNCVLGHIVAGAISLSLTYIPESILPTWIRQMVAPAFAIGAMVKLGITHPPAGAFSVIFAQGQHNWGFYGIAVLCSVISIIPAIIVNNMSQKRQYPTYWGFPSSRWGKAPRMTNNAMNDK